MSEETIQDAPVESKEQTSTEAPTDASLDTSKVESKKSAEPEVTGQKDVTMTGKLTTFPDLYLITYNLLSL
jgi:hypothetical protein